MKPLYLVVLILATLLSTDLYAVECKIMSFNVRYGSAQDGDNDWEHRKALLVKTIREAAPDILGTQECLDFQAAYIAEALPEYGWIGLGRQEDGTGEMTAVFYRKSALLPIETSHHWLSESPELPGSKSWDSSLPRIATRVKFFHIQEKVPFVFYNTHFDHKGQVAREESAKLLATILKSESLPVILTGDFNALGGDSLPWTALIEGGFHDAWDNASKRQGPANTWNGFEVPTSDRRIDWIMVSDKVTVSDCTIHDKGENGHYPSDHFPVIATISFP
tara:strand:- start:690 stop:1520 length:831 start_codon:yes stop_codon:yes gene_type:complete